MESKRPFTVEYTGMGYRQYFATLQEAQVAANKSGFLYQIWKSERTSLRMVKSKTTL